MRYKPKLYQNNKRSAAFIYAVTFNSGFSVVLVLTLFISFLIQPIHKAFASEDAITVDVEKIHQLLNRLLYKPHQNLQKLLP